MEDFCIRLAGIPVRVRCRYVENRVFLQGYFTEEAPLFTIEPSIEDLEKIQRDINLLEKGENRRKEVFRGTSCAAGAWFCPEHGWIRLYFYRTKRGGKKYSCPIVAESVRRSGADDQ